MQFSGKYCINVWLLRIFTAVVLFSVFFNSHAQRFFRPEIRETLSSGFYVKTHFLQFKDDTFSPLRYNGPSGEVRYLSVRYPSGFRSSLSLGMQAGYFENRFSFNGWQLNPRFSFTFAAKLEGASGRGVRTFIGPAVTGNSRITLYKDEDPDHIYWFTSYSMDLFFVTEIELERDRMLFLEIRAPLAAMVSRTAQNNTQSYHIMETGEIIKRIHRDISFYTVDNLQSVNLKLMVDLSRTNRGSVTLGYEADFTSFSGSAPVLYFNNGILLRVMFDSHIR